MKEVRISKIFGFALVCLTIWAVLESAVAMAFLFGEFGNQALAQIVPELEWSKAFGGPSDDTGRSVSQTSDGGYIITGDTNSYGAGGYDVWLIKTDRGGNMQWNKTFGGSDDDIGYCVQQTSDGGYIIAGTTRSYGAGSGDVWLIKTDANGNKAWNETFGGTGDDTGYSVQQTRDSGYIIVGCTWSYGAGSGDVWLIKTDVNGNKIWDKTFGGEDWDGGSAVQETSDSGYAIVGTTNPPGADTRSDVWLIKTDANGNKLWDKMFDSHSDYGRSGQQTCDGGFIIVADTTGGLGYDAWLIKTDSDGNRKWNGTLGPQARDTFGHSVQQTSDGGYIMVGTYDAGNKDVWAVKVDCNGNKIWGNSFGGKETDRGRSVWQTSDGGYIIAGTTRSYGAGNKDVWLIKLAAETQPAPTPTPIVTTPSPMKKGSLKITVKDEKGNPISDANVFVDNEMKGKTDQDGILLIEDIEEGGHSIRLTKAGFIDKSFTKDVVGGMIVTKSIILSPSAIVTTPSPMKKGSLKITVTDKKGNPISNVNVFVDNEMKGKTDEEGILLIEDIEEGEHSIRLTKTDFIDKSFRKDVVGGMIVEEIVTMTEEIVTMTEEKPLLGYMTLFYITVATVISIVGAYFFLNTKKKQEKVFVIKGLMKCKEGIYMKIRDSIKEASTELLRDIKEHPWKYEYDSNDEESKQIYEEVCEELRRRTKEEKGSIERSYGTWESLSGRPKSSQKEDVERFWRSFIIVLVVPIGGVLALIGTSLPWISAGPVSLSGMDISNAISWLERLTSMMDEPIPTEIRLFRLIPAFIAILGILCIVFAILGLVKPKAGGTGSLVCGLLIVILSIISIIGISELISEIKEMMEMVPFVGEMAAGMIGVGYGLYLCILGGLLALVGGVVGRKAVVSST